MPAPRGYTFAAWPRWPCHAGRASRPVPNGGLAAARFEPRPRPRCLLTRESMTGTTMLHASPVREEHLTTLLDNSSARSRRASERAASKSRWAAFTAFRGLRVLPTARAVVLHGVEVLLHASTGHSSSAWHRFSTPKGVFELNSGQRTVLTRPFSTCTYRHSRAGLVPGPCACPGRPRGPPLKRACEIRRPQTGEPAPNHPALRASPP